MDPVIHILVQGFPLCQRTSKLGVPRDWPPGHKWVTMDESSDSNCDHCREERKARARPVVTRRSA